MKKKVVVTGLGIISSLGNSLEETKISLEKNIRNYSTIPDERFSTDHKFYRNNKGFRIDQDLYECLKNEEVSLLYPLASKSIKEALDDSRLSMRNLQEKRSGLCLGTSVGASYVLIERIKNKIFKNEDNFSYGKYTTPVMIGKIASDFRLNGSVSTISTACASGTNSIGRAFDLIQNGREDIMICGGLDIFTELTYSGFNSLFAISKDVCKPFSEQRDGMSLGDACAILILETYDSAKARGANIYGEIKSYYTLNEAYHPTAPHPDGVYAYSCMKNALHYGNIAIEEVDYINAHGTGTEKNDISELKGMDLLLQNKEVKTYANSTKGFTGHTLGAAGSIEAIISLLSIKNNTLYACNNQNSYLHSDKIKFVEKNIENIHINALISNSFGFGGNMASKVIKNTNN